MRGFLIVNGFLQTEKFQRLYALLKSAAHQQGIELEIRTGDTLFNDIQSDKGQQDLPDFALFWDKDIYLAKRLEALGIPLFNSAKTVEICDNKLLTALALIEQGIATPRTVFAPKTFEGVGYTNVNFLNNAERLLGYPMVMKEACGSFGAQVYLAQNRTQALKILQKIGHKEFLMQEFIAESRGKDIRVNVVGGEVVCAILRENPNDFRSNISGGGRASAYEPTEREKSVAIAACRAVGADFAGVDILFGKDGPLVCEVNSNPHFASTLDCTGVDLSENILRYIKEKI